MDKFTFKNDPSLVERIADQLSEDPSLKAFFLDNDISYEQIKEGVSEIKIYQNEIALCDDCPGLFACKQDVLGHQPVLTLQNGRIEIAYQACPYQQEKSHSKSGQKWLDATHLPKTLFLANLADFRQDTQGRQLFYQKVMQTAQAIKLKESSKGLYLYGPYMAGKTYALAAMANHFTSLNQSVLMTYYPDFVREIKSTIENGGMEQKIQNFKTCDVLILDDIGGESFSPWVRDEILGPILQHRLLDQKLTYFSSNIPPKALLNIFMANESETEKMKAFRIIERIQAMATPIAF